MCIRDSATIERLKQEVKQYQVESEELAAEVKMLEVELAESSKPVSYTHLRAHETVLDLVCRLLLEKKNNMSTPPHSTSTTDK